MKKNILLMLLTFLIFNEKNLLAQNIAINSTGNAPNSSAMLDVQSTTKGMLIPRMSTTQRTAIASPATGLLVYDNTTGSFWFKNASKWVELIDSSNNTWTKNSSNNVYVNNGENVGIGTNSPAVRLQVSNGTDIANGTGGYLELGSPSNPNLALDNNEIQARKNGSASDLYMQVGGGNVGVGTNNAEVKLQVSNGTDVSANGGGYLQLGSGNSSNIGLDNNEIQARNNGSASTLYLQHSGGTLEVGSSGNSANLNMANGKLTTAKTGSTHNLLPLCYGKVSNSGVLQSYTDNVSLYRSDGTNGERYFEIDCPGINVGTVMMVTPNQKYDNQQMSAVAVYHSAGVARIYILDGFSGEVYSDFSFIFYNQ